MAKREVTGKDSSVIVPADALPDLPDNELGEPISLPGALALAFQSDRPELCRMWKGPMDDKTAEAMAHALGVLMRRNRQLRDKLTALKRIAVDGILGGVGQLNAFMRRLGELDEELRKYVVDDSE